MVFLQNGLDDNDEIYSNLETSAITFFLIRLKTLINGSKKYSIDEIENDPFFIKSRDTLIEMSINNSVLIPLITSSVQLLNDLNNFDNYLPIEKKNIDQLNSILIILKILSIAIEKNWASSQSSSNTTTTTTTTNNNNNNNINNIPFNFNYSSVNPDSKNSIDFGTYLFKNKNNYLENDILNINYFNFLYPSISYASNENLFTLDSSLISKTLDTLVQLKSSLTVNNELISIYSSPTSTNNLNNNSFLNIINNQVSNFTNHKFKHLIRIIDVNCSAIIRFLSASNPLEFSTYLINKIVTLSHDNDTNNNNISLIDQSLYKYFDALNYIYLNPTLIKDYFKKIWDLLIIIKKINNQHFILSFFINSIKYWIFSKPDEYISSINPPINPPNSSSINLSISTIPQSDACSTTSNTTATSSSSSLNNLNLSQEAEKLFEYLYPTFNYSGSFLSILLTLSPSTFDYFLSNLNKNKSNSTRINRKQRFLQSLIASASTSTSTFTSSQNSLLSSPSSSSSSSSSYNQNELNSQLDASSSLISIFFIASSIQFLQPENPIVKFSSNYLSLVENFLKIKDDQPPLLNLCLDPLRVNFFCTTSILNPNHLILTITQSLSDPNSTLHSIKIILLGLKTLTYFPKLDNTFKRFVSLISSQLRDQMLKVTETIQATSFPDDDSISLNNLNLSNKNPAFKNNNLSLSSLGSNSTLLNQNQPLPQPQPQSLSQPLINKKYSKTPSNTNLSSLIPIQTSSNTSVYYPQQKSQKKLMKQNKPSKTSRFKFKDKNSSSYVQQKNSIMGFVTNNNNNNHNNIGSSIKSNNNNSNSQTFNHRQSSSSGSSELNPPNSNKLMPISSNVLLNNPDSSSNYDTSQISDSSNVDFNLSTYKTIVKLKAAEHQRKLNDPKYISRDILATAFDIFIYCPNLYLFGSKDQSLLQTSIQLKPIIKDDELIDFFRNIKEYLSCVVNALIDDDTKLIESAICFFASTLKLSTGSDANKNQIYFGLLASNYVIISLAEMLLKYRLSDKKVYDILSIIILLLNSRRKFIEKVDLLELIDKLSNNDDQAKKNQIYQNIYTFCDKMYYQLQKCFYICLCSPQLQTFNLTKRGIDSMLNELNILDPDSSKLVTDSNFKFYKSISDDSYVITGLVALQKRVRNLLAHVEVHEQSLVDSWNFIYDRWLNLLNNQTSGQSLTEQRNYSGFLASTCGIMLKADHKRGKDFENVISLVENFISKQVESLGSSDLLIREASKDVLSNEIHPLASRLINDQLALLIKQLHNKPTLDDNDLTTIDQVCYVLESLLSTKDESLMFQTSLKVLTVLCNLISLLLDYPSDNIAALKVQIKFYNIIQTVYLSQVPLLLKGGIKLKNILLKSCSQIFERSIFYQEGSKPSGTKTKSDESQLRKQRELVYMNIDLASQSIKAIAILLDGLILSTPQAQNEDEYQRSKKIVFGNYFSLFLRVLEKFNSTKNNKFNSELFSSYKHKFGNILDNTIISLTNLLKYNVDAGLEMALPLGFHDNSRIRLAFLKVFTNIMEELKELTKIDQKYIRQETLELVFSITGIETAMANSCPPVEVDLLASSMLHIWESKGKGIELINSLIKNEILKSPRITDILRRNSVATRMLSNFAKDDGKKYLKTILKPLLNRLIYNGDYFEVEKLSIDDPNSQENLTKFMIYLNDLVDTIVNSVHLVPADFMLICSIIEETSHEKFEANTQLIGVGSFIFLRFFCPSIVSPETHSLTPAKYDMKAKRSFIQLAKVLQNIANRSLALLKWPLLSSKMEELYKLSDKIFSFLRTITYDIKYNLQSPENIEINDKEIDYLHSFIYDHWVDIRINFFSYPSAMLQNFSLENIRVFQNADAKLGSFGQPRKISNSPIPDNIKNDESCSALCDFMNKYASCDLTAAYNIPFIYESISRDGTPIIIFTYYYFQKLQINGEIALFRFFQTLSKFWHNKYYIFCDYTQFDPSLEKINFDTVESFSPDIMCKNCAGVFYYNLSRAALLDVSTNIKNRGTNKFLNPFKVRYIFLSLFDDPHLLASLGLTNYGKKIISDPRISFSEILIYQESENKFVPITIKVGTEYLQFGINRPQRIKVGGAMKGIRVIDVNHISDLSSTILSNNTDSPNEFTIINERNGKKYVFSSPKKLEIVRSIYFAKARAMKEKINTERSKSILDYLGEILNINFLGLVSDSQDVRSECYNLLGAIFKSLELENKRRVSSGIELAFPKDHSSFVSSISNSIASSFPNITYQFIKGFFDAYRSSEIHKIHCILYVSPWIKNIYSHVFANGDEDGPDKAAELIREFVKISIGNNETNLVSFNVNVWSKLVLEDRLASILVDEVIATAIDFEAEGEYWPSVISLISSTPTNEICSLVISRLKDKIKKIPPYQINSIATQTSWIEVTVLIKISVYLFFDALSYIEMFLPDIFFIASVLINIGSLELRKSLHSLIMNILHGILEKSDLAKSHIDSIQDVIGNITGEKSKMLFGLFNAKLEANTDDGSLVVTKFPGLELFVDYLIRVMNMVDETNKKTWKIKWNSYIVDLAFTENVLLQPRALLVLGYLNKTSASDFLVIRTIDVFSKTSSTLSSPVQFATSNVCAIHSLSKFVDGLASGSPYIKHLFWVATSLALVDNVEIYQAALQLVSGTLEAMKRNNIFQSENFILTLFETRSFLEPEIQNFEELYDILFDERQFDSIIIFLITKGLTYQKTKHLAILFLKNFFQIRCKATIDYAKTHKINTFDSNAVSYLLLIFILNENSELLTIVGEAGLDSSKVIRLHDNIDIPKVLIDYILTGKSQPIVSLILASYYFISNLMDDSSKLKYLLLIRFICQENIDILFSFYSIIRPTIRRIIAKSSSLENLTIVYDIVKMVLLKLDVKELPEKVRAAEELLINNNLSGIKNYRFSKEELLVNLPVDAKSGDNDMVGMEELSFMLKKISKSFAGME
ncbi:RasGAP domain-containing protein ASCRUDRAFT_73863 [Ascoidea rubescens DSM 1968]|uniref:Ras-GAP domain-containing protein n=1 Tax=Ascoidea rubescens DSM 1968 TaxID=1344418 RepID=A0A1D2VRE9_9ASCO|nr:hypothetical protein ASCRUDRAFT_73863 [Ascoidea rubescens DSM 1968]ODV64184.1 hypothetical protein ASCRUDRAFT_73863 [Ascoidea rubescens DSM 1968]